MSTPFDIESAVFLNKIDVPAFKISSSDNDNIFLIEIIKKFQKPVIISSGMTKIDQLKKIINFIRFKKDKLAILHCVSEYPTNIKDVNLNAIKTISKKFNYPIGYSDHTIGNEVSIAALGMGCNYFEKHFTLDKNLIGPEHKASLSIEELNIYVSTLKKIHISLGDGIKKPSNNETINKKIVRRSIVAKVDIKKGDIFTENNLVCKRPGNGISPMEWNSIRGKKAIKYFSVD